MTPTCSLRRLVVMLCCAALSPTTVSADDEILEQVRAAWQARQERFERGKIIWREFRSYAANEHPYTGDDRRLATGSPAVDGIETRCEFAFDGSKGRYKWAGTNWNEQQGEFDQQSRTWIFDGREQRSCRIFDDGTRSFGTLEKQAVGLDLVGLGSPIEPVALAFRPLSPVFVSLPLDGFVARGDEEILRETSCHRLQTSPDRHGLQHVLWLDPQREFIVLRHEVLIRQFACYRYDIEYDDSADAIPKSWSRVGFNVNTRKFRSRLTATVESVELNEPISGAEFTLSYPPGTQVNEVGSSVGIHVARKDGSLRRIERGELRGCLKTYDLVSRRAMRAMRATWMKAVLDSIVRS